MSTRLYWFHIHLFDTVGKQALSLYITIKFLSTRRNLKVTIPSIHSLHKTLTKKMLLLGYNKPVLW